MEEDEFGQKQNGELSSLKKVFRDEYILILDAFTNAVLLPFVNKGQEIDRSTMSMAKSDLEWKLSCPEFKKLPFHIQDAYIRLKTFIDVLENTKDEEISNHKEVFRELANLSDSCLRFGPWIGYSKTPRDYCREPKYKLNSAISIAEKRSPNSELLEAEKGMLEVCKKCPYR